MSNAAANYLGVIAGLLLAALSLGLLYVLLEVAMGATAPEGGVLNVYNRTTTAGLDCYPSNPRGYFDLDLRDPATRERAQARLDELRKNIAHALPHELRTPLGLVLGYSNLLIDDVGPENIGDPQCFSPIFRPRVHLDERGLP